MQLLWFIDPSLVVDYGTFTCQECGSVFHYSPRLACHCNSCAIIELEEKKEAEQRWFTRMEYARALEQLREL